ncbi:MAG: sulfite exporter TauE/SafE family protein [Moraxella sp.]|uniref:sulfite exporter TauE/SafE family protein n=1 Tax=Moraxella sp. TaxID=479 RepID=UPI0026DCA90F|nr:sulfite exporter TauE/SafE family protein [Moraxella sp.]MDO4450624.1 sulfite exporter TauE/SafE family protein [Moraxella sp.]
MMYLWFVIAGTFAGVCAGLFGVGGGLIIVPALVWILGAYGMPVDVLTHVAVGTALATIILTSISSMSAHHKRGGVRWDVFKNMVVGLVVGSLVGAWVATMINGQSLQAIIGGGAVLAAIKMLFFPNKENPNSRLPKPYMQGIISTLIGSLSAIFGIGGGTVIVPYLSGSGLPMKQAVGTSSACGLPIAIAGTLGFIWFGRGAVSELDVAGTLGFIHIGAFISISICSFVMAKVGAKLAHVLPAKTLKQAFGCLLMVVGCQLIYKGLLG